MVYYSNGQLIVRNMEQKDAQAIADAEIKQGWNASVEKYQKRLEDQESGSAGRCWSIPRATVWRLYAARWQSIIHDMISR